MNSDPPRLLDDPSAAASLRGDLAQAADVRLEGLDLDQGLAQLRTATTTSPPAVSGGLSLGAKLGLGAALAAVAVALWAARPDATPESAVATAPPITTPIPSTTPTPAPTSAPESTLVPPSPEPGLLLDEPEPGVPPSAEGPAIAPEDGSQTELPRVARRKATTPASEAGSDADAEANAEAGEAEPADDVLREARMVAEARASLARDPDRALRLADQAEKEFPDGQLVEERRAIAIRALAALGRGDEARRRADDFLQRFGRGAHADAVRRAIAEP